MALVLQADLAEVGIELELIKMETAALKGILNDAALDYDLCLYQFTDNLGTDFTLRNQYGSYEEDGVLKKNGSNRANMKNTSTRSFPSSPSRPPTSTSASRRASPASSGTAPQSTTTATSACPLRNPIFSFKFQSEQQTGRGVKPLPSYKKCPRAWKSVFCAVC